jgi:hypothetical protein
MHVEVDLIVDELGDVAIIKLKTKDCFFPTFTLEV